VTQILGGKELIFLSVFFSFWEDIFDFCNYLSSLEVLNFPLQVNLDPANRCPDADCTCSGSLTDMSINRLYGIYPFGLEFWDSVPGIWWSLLSIRR